MSDCIYNLQEPSTLLCAFSCCVMKEHYILMGTLKLILEWSLLCYNFFIIPALKLYPLWNYTILSNPKIRYGPVFSSQFPNSWNRMQWIVMVWRWVLMRANGMIGSLMCHSAGPQYDCYKFTKLHFFWNFFYGMHMQVPLTKFISMFDVTWFVI